MAGCERFDGGALCVLAKYPRGRVDRNALAVRASAIARFYTTPERCGVDRTRAAEECARRVHVEKLVVTWMGLPMRFQDGQEFIKGHELSFRSPRIATQRKATARLSNSSRRKKWWLFFSAPDYVIGFCSYPGDNAILFKQIARNGRRLFSCIKPRVQCSQP